MSVIYKSYMTKEMIDITARISLQEASKEAVSDIKSNIISMNIYDSGREHDSVMAISNNWETSMGGKALSEDKLIAPSADLTVRIGSDVPYAMSNEFGNGIEAPRPAFRNIIIDDRKFSDTMSREFNKRLP